MGQGAGARWVLGQAQEGQNGREQGTLSTPCPATPPADGQGSVLLAEFSWHCPSCRRVESGKLQHLAAHPTLLMAQGSPLLLFQPGHAAPASHFTTRPPCLR